MATKNINARITNKIDTETNWKKAVNFTPLKGEVIVYDKDSTHSYQRIKVGDGVTNVNDLPFTSSQPEWTQTEIKSLLGQISF